MSAYRILEGVADPAMALSICDSLLTQNLRVGQTLFIIQFMLTNLPSLLSAGRLEALLWTKMGAKALLCLPQAARPDYEHLVSRPPLLLEQLLMNMKVEWAGKVFQRIQVRAHALVSHLKVSGKSGMGLGSTVLDVDIGNGHWNVRDQLQTLKMFDSAHIHKGQLLYPAFGFPYQMRPISVQRKPAQLTVFV